MSYFVTCPCGRNQEVQASQAGSPIHCICGRVIDVPALSKLRASAGEEAIPRSTIERIQAMIRAGALPTGEVCPFSGRPANDVIMVRVQCERSWVTGGPISFPEKFLAFALFGLGGFLIASRMARPKEELGRETSVDVPLRISGDCRSKLLRMKKQRRWKRLLRQTPIYNELLNEFPGALITPCTETWAMSLARAAESNSAIG